MDFLQLKYCVEAAKYMNFTRAAEQCYVSQSAISVQISKLESELGIKIFLRTHKGVAITKEGTVFLEYANQILQLEAQMKRDFRMFQNDRSGYISIGLAQCGSLYLLTNLLSAFQTKFPDIQLNIQEGDSSQLKELLRDNALAAAFLSDMVLPDEFLTYELFEDEVVLVTGKDHPLANKECIQLEELRGYELLFSENSSILKALQSTPSLLPEGDPSKRLFFQTKITKNTHILTNMSLVSNGLAATLVTKNSAEKYGGPKIHVAKIMPHLSRYIYLAVPKQSVKIPAVNSFLHFALDFPSQSLK